MTPIASSDVVLRQKDSLVVHFTVQAGTKEEVIPSLGLLKILWSRDVDHVHDARVMPFTPATRDVKDSKFLTTQPSSEVLAMTAEGEIERPHIHYDQIDQLSTLLNQQEVFCRSAEVRSPPFTITTDVPTQGVVGKPFLSLWKIRNNTNNHETVEIQVEDDLSTPGYTEPSILWGGPRIRTLDVLPKDEATIPFTIVPLQGGKVSLPQLQVRLASTKTPLVTQDMDSAHTIFVLPTEY